MVNFSCQKDDAVDTLITKEVFSAPTIENAQNHYGQTQKNTSNQNARTQPISITDWERSAPKKYKQTQELDVDILYTPIYLNTEANLKGFIASTEINGVVDARKLYVLYKNTNDNTNLSAYIFIYGLDGVLQHIYNYENGVQIPLPEYASTINTRTDHDCSKDFSNMSDDEFEDFFAFCYSYGQEEVVIYAPPASGGVSFGDGPSGWVGMDVFNGNNQSPGGPSVGTNPQVFTPNSIAATAESISHALYIDISNTEMQWLNQQQQANNQSILNAIATFLNANKERPIGSQFQNMGNNQFPQVTQEAIDTVLEIINNLINSNSNAFMECLDNGGSLQECNSESTFVIEDCVNDPANNDGITLSPQQLAVLQGLDPEQQEAIQQYLITENSCSPAAQSFLLEYLDAANKIKFDSTVPDCLEDIIFDLVLGDFEDNIDDFGSMGNIQLIKDVFTTLNTGSGGELNFEFTYKVANISGNGSTSQTIYDPTSQIYSIDITIDNDLIANGSKLAIVKTVLHESIHAYLKYIAKQFPAAFSDPNGSFSTLISAWQNYNNDNNFSQHVYMASIITNMANNVSNFVQAKYGYPASTIDYYEAVCWSGIADIRDPFNPGPDNNPNIVENPLFLLNYPSLSDRDNIRNIIHTENGTATFPGYSKLKNDNCN